MLHFVALVRGVRSNAEGYIGIYTPQNQSTLQIFMWLLVVFFSSTQDKFDIVPVCALARVSFTYLRTTIYTPPQINSWLRPWLLYRVSRVCSGIPGSYRVARVFMGRIS